jgi:hypothetical protein
MSRDDTGSRRGLSSAVTFPPVGGGANGRASSCGFGPEDLGAAGWEVHRGIGVLQDDLVAEVGNRDIVLVVLAEDLPDVVGSVRAPRSTPGVG